MLRLITKIKLSQVIIFIAVLLFIYVFFINAWVCDDAYITFRTINQFYSGNGLVWNPNQRVQSYTHPLWLIMLIISYFLKNNLFINSIILAFFLTALCVFVILRNISDKKYIPLIIIFITLSRAFIDYSTSGLENPLSHLLVVLFFYFYLKLFSSKKIEINLLKIITFLSSLILITRMDLGILTILPLAYSFIFFYRKRVNKWSLLKIFLIYNIPFISWSIFSLVYYGFLIPNTAYAKLNLDIPPIALYLQGLRYLQNSLIWDVITLPTIIFTILILFRNSNIFLQIIPIGIVIYLLYITSIGGDFMSGRFFTAPFILSILVLTMTNEAVKFIKKFRMLFYTFILIAFLHPLSTYKNTVYGKIDKYGISDERGFYYHQASLSEYFKNRLPYFPVSDFTVAGIEYSKSEELITTVSAIGYFGYAAGVDKIIVDPMALADPLLSRIPVSGESGWRVGHYTRTPPEGYIESILSNENKIKDKKLSQLYQEIKIITQGPIFSKKRFISIIKINLPFLFR